MTGSKFPRKFSYEEPLQRARNGDRGDARVCKSELPEPHKANTLGGGPAVSGAYVVEQDDEES